MWDEKTRTITKIKLAYNCAVVLPTLDGTWEPSVLSQCPKTPVKLVNAGFIFWLTVKWQAEVACYKMCWTSVIKEYNQHIIIVS